MADKTVEQQLDEKHAELVREWLEIAQRIEGDVQRIASIKAELEAMPKGTYTAPDLPVRAVVTQGSTFKADRFAALYPPTTPENVTSYYKLVPDADKIKAAFSPVAAKAFRENSKPSVTLK